MAEVLSLSEKDKWAPPNPVLLATGGYLGLMAPRSQFRDWETRGENEYLV